MVSCPVTCDICKRQGMRIIFGNIQYKGSEFHCFNDKKIYLKPENIFFTDSALDREIFMLLQVNVRILALDSHPPFRSRREY